MSNFPCQTTITLPTRPNEKKILLFDVDGTLTAPRNPVTPEMHQFIKDLRKRAYIGIVGGSDLTKVTEQLGEDLLAEWDYVFVENGLVAFKGGQQIAQQSILNYLGEERLQKFLNFTLRYLADLTIPVKRGTFIEFRNGMINISPIGRNCSQSERNEFEKYDHVHNIRQTMVDALRTEFADYNLTYSIGGQISFDVFPVGWDKTFCLQYLSKDGFDEIHFFGDKTMPGGNDYEIFTSDQTIGHSVTSFLDTQQQVERLLE